MGSKQPHSSEQAALLPASAPPPYTEHAAAPASSSSPLRPQRAPHALGPTPVGSLPAPPPSLYAQQRTAHARADARARRRFCGALCCAALLWLVMGAVFGAVVGEEVARRGGEDGRFAVWRAAASVEQADSELARTETPVLGERDSEAWVSVEGADVEAPVDLVATQPDYAAS
ncbi:hypothetical protein JCM3770_006253 [Rhodotorula araucariae]